MCYEMYIDVDDMMRSVLKGSTESTRSAEMREDAGGASVRVMIGREGW